MAAENSTENFQGRASFFVLGDFGMIFFFFFFKMSSIRFSFRIWNWFFSRFGLWHPKTGPKSKKWVRKQSNDTKAGITRYCNELRPTFFTNSQTSPDDFQKSGDNLTSDLLIFNFWACFCPKKHQIPQKVIVFLIQNCDQIEP